MSFRTDLCKSKNSTYSRRFLMLEFVKEYKDYIEFYTENKEVIYRKILSLYEEMRNEGWEGTFLEMDVKNIDNFNYVTKIPFESDQKGILEKSLLPYFEKREDFDTCIRIRNLIGQQLEVI